MTANTGPVLDIVSIEQGEDMVVIETRLSQ